MDHPPDDPRRRLLAVVPYSRLAEWARDAGVAESLPGTAPLLAEALLAARRFPRAVERILERMSPPELDLACRDLGGIGGSIDRARLEARILAIIAPPSASSGTPPTPLPKPDLPVGAWLEGRRHRAALASEAGRRERLRTNEQALRAAGWGALFLVFSWIFVFSHTFDAILLGIGAGAIAIAIYRYELSVPLAMGVAALEVAARLLIFGVSDAPVVPLVSISVAEFVLAAVMSIDAVSASGSEIAPELLPRPRAPVPPAAEEPAPVAAPDPGKSEPLPSRARDGAAGRTAGR